MTTIDPGRTVLPQRTGTVPAGWRIWLAAWPVMAVFALSNMATPLYPLWRQRMGFSTGTLTVVFACYIVGLLGSLMMAGRLADRIGRKPVLVPGILLAIVACLVFATATSVVALTIARLLTGIAIGITVSAGMAAVVDVGGPHRTRQATLAASTAMVLGAGLGPLSAGLLAQTLPGPTVSTFLVEVILLLSAVWVALRLPLSRPAPAKDGRWLRLPSVPPGNGPQVALGIAVFAPGITSTSFMLSLGPSLLATLGTTSRLAAGAMAFVMFASAAGAQFAARSRPVRTILLAGAVSAVASMAALILAVQASWIVMVVAAAILAGVAQGLGQLGGLSLISSAVPADRRAEANATLNIGGYVPAALLPVTAGYLGDASGLTTGSTVFGTFVIIAAAAGAAFVQARAPRTTKPTHPERPPGGGGDRP
jgi:MFS family permease